MVRSLGVMVLKLLPNRTQYGGHRNVGEFDVVDQDVHDLAQNKGQGRRSKGEKLAAAESSDELALRCTRKKRRTVARVRFQDPVEEDTKAKRTRMSL